MRPNISFDEDSFARNELESDLNRFLAEKNKKTGRTFPDVAMELLDGGDTNILLVSDGGFGKSCALIELYRRLLNRVTPNGSKKMIPIFVAATACGPSDDIHKIRKYIATHYYGDSLCISEEQQIQYINNYDEKVFKKADSKYHFVIIVDGINESGNERSFYPEIMILSKFENVSVILSSRNTTSNITKDYLKAGFTAISLHHIDSKTASAILNKANANKFDNRFYTPFYLSLILKSGLSLNEVSNQYELLNQYIDFTTKKLFPHVENKALFGESLLEDLDVVFFDLLPLICFFLIKNDRLVLTVSNEDNLVCSILSLRSFKDYNINETILDKICKKILVPAGIIIPTLSKPFEYRIAHEIIRDYFGVKHIRSFTCCDKDVVEILKSRVSDEFIQLLVQSFESGKDAISYFTYLNNEQITRSKELKSDAVLNKNIIKIISFFNNTIHDLDLSDRDLSEVDFTTISQIANCDLSNSAFNDFGPFSSIDDSFNYKIQQNIKSVLPFDDNTVLITSTSQDRFYNIITGEMIKKLNDDTTDIIYTCTVIHDKNTVVHGTEHGKLVYINTVDNSFEYVNVVLQADYEEIINSNSKHYSTFEDSGISITDVFCLPDGSIIAKCGSVLFLIDDKRQVVNSYSNVLDVISQPEYTVAFTDESFIIFFSAKCVNPGKLVEKLSRLADERRNCQLELFKSIESDIKANPLKFREEQLIGRLMRMIVSNHPGHDGSFLDSMSAFLDMCPTYGFDHVFDFSIIGDETIYVTFSQICIISKEKQFVFDVESFSSQVFDTDIESDHTAQLEKQRLFPKFSGASIDKSSKKIVVICSINYSQKAFIIFDIPTKSYHIESIKDIVLSDISSILLKNNSLTIVSDGVKHSFSVYGNIIRHISAIHYSENLFLVSDLHTLNNDFYGLSCWRKNELMWTKKYPGFLNCVKKAYYSAENSRIYFLLRDRADSLIIFDTITRKKCIHSLAFPSHDYDQLSWMATIYMQLDENDDDIGFSDAVDRYYDSKGLSVINIVSLDPCIISVNNNLWMVNDDFSIKKALHSNDVFNLKDFRLLEKVILAYKHLYSLDKSNQVLYCMSAFGVGVKSDLVYWTYNLKDNQSGPYIELSDHFEDFKMIDGSNLILTLSEGELAIIELKESSYRLKTRQSCNSINSLSQVSNLILVENGIIGVCSKGLICINFSGKDTSVISIDNLIGLSTKSYNKQPFVFCQDDSGKTSVLRITTKNDELQTEFVFSMHLDCSILDIIIPQKDEIYLVQRNKVIIVDLTNGTKNTLSVYNKDLSNSKFTDAKPISKSDLDILSQYGAIY